MILLFFYGPPACGKLTTATELSKIADYKVFHNHLTQDLAGSLYPELNSIRYTLVEKLRLDVISYAAQQNTNLIYTQFYTGDEDDKKFVEDVIKAVTAHNGIVYFVKITAPLDILKQRVSNESRKSYGKAQDIASLNRYLATIKEQAIENKNHITIDSSKQDATVAAEIIKNTLDLH